MILYYAIVSRTAIIYAQGSSLKELKKNVKKKAKEIGDTLYSTTPKGELKNDEIAYSKIAGTTIYWEEMNIDTLMEVDWQYIEWL